MEQWFLVAANFCFLVSFGYTIYALRAKSFRPGGFNLLAIGIGFASQSAYLYLRGQQVGACPLNTLFDLLVFLGWAIVLIYLVIGPAYRLSLMGAFTAPLVLLLQLAALLLVGPPPPVTGPVAPPNAWIELHAALSVVAYGAFVLAGISGWMYLLQERQIKRHHVSTLFYNLPPIQDLTQANGRLIFLGFCLLTVAFIAGLVSRLPVDGLKFWVSLLIWAAYGILLLLRKYHRLPPRRLAKWSVGIFLFLVITLPGVHYLSASGGGQ